MTNTKGSPDDIDRFVSSKLCEFMKEKYVTEEALAEKIGVTFQQVQKYKNASNRMAAGRLYAISKVLGVEIQEFFP